MRSGRPAFLLDGDNLRHGLNADLGFSDRDRTENVRRAGEVACMFAESGALALIALICPFEEDRRLIRTLHEQANLPFVEIFVDTSLEECERRDPKGLYAASPGGAASRVHRHRFGLRGAGAAGPGPRARLGLALRADFRRSRTAGRDSALTRRSRSDGGGSAPTAETATSPGGSTADGDVVRRGGDHGGTGIDQDGRSGLTEARPDPELPRAVVTPRVHISARRDPVGRLAARGEPHEVDARRAGGFSPGSPGPRWPLHLRVGRACRPPRRRCFRWSA